jgi:hypothetical protein
MGYNLKIGELKTNWNTDDGRESTIELSVEVERGRKEPFLNVGEPTDGMNVRWPSYTSWSNFAKSADLYDFFFDKCEGLIREHPATFPLCEEHREIVNAKYKAFKDKHPKSKPTYDDENNEHNAVLVRFEWLKYWINWALDNCEKPVFYNS